MFSKIDFSAKMKVFTMIFNVLQKIINVNFITNVSFL